MASAKIRIDLLDRDLTDGLKESGEDDIRAERVGVGVQLMWAFGLKNRASDG